MRFDLIAGNLSLFAQGIWLTLELTFIATMIGFCVALPSALAKVRRMPFLEPLLRGYCTLICGTPLTVQLLFAYFVLPELPGIRSTWAWLFLRDPWWCAVIAFSLSAAAYWIVLLASEIEATPKGIMEAAAALGLTSRQSTWLVLIPSVLRRLLPQAGNEVVLMMHASALASVVTLQDILGVARTFNARHYLALEGLLVAAVLYIALTFTLIGAFALLERRYLAYLGPNR